jgi:uncharacterized membrane protein
VRDSEGATRVLVRTPDWEDYVRISCVEIRHCGAGSIQVARRMHAMLADLAALLPAIRRPALEAERQLLERAVRAQMPFAEDAMLASVPDVQGMGGSARVVVPAARAKAEGRVTA